ncbi:hypothetical protein EVA_06630 [gut metagenome]|uniref:Uncharacterized protein n=1 Tax=gut metagenome TaxID=749906 RepID=J9GEE5_9ZZZZ
MKQKIINALATKFPGVSEKILGRVADKLLKVIKQEDQIDTEVEKVEFQQILESYGDARADEAQKTAVSNYEKKHGLKDGIKLTGEDGGNDKDNGNAKNEPDHDGRNDGKGSKADDGQPEWAKGLILELKSVKEELASVKGERTANKRKASLDEILTKAPEKVKERYAKDYQRMTFKDDDDFNAWIEEIKPDIEAIASDWKTKGGVVGRPKGGGGKNEPEINPILAERIKQQSEADKQDPAIQGLAN